MSPAQASARLFASLQLAGCAPARGFALRNPRNTLALRNRLESTRACPQFAGLLQNARACIRPLELAAKRLARRRRLIVQCRPCCSRGHAGLVDDRCTPPPALIPLAASWLQQLPYPLPPAPASLAMLSESSAPCANPPPSSGPAGRVQLQYANGPHVCASSEQFAHTFQMPLFHRPC